MSKPIKIFSMQQNGTYCSLKINTRTGCMPCKTYIFNFWHKTLIFFPVKFVTQMWMLAVLCIAMENIHWIVHPSHYNCCYLYTTLFINYLALLAWLKLPYWFPEDWWRHLTGFFLIYGYGKEENVLLKPFKYYFFFFFLILFLNNLALFANSPREFLCFIFTYLNSHSQLVKCSCPHLGDHLSRQAYKIKVCSLGKQSRSQMSISIIRNIKSARVNCLKFIYKIKLVFQLETNSQEEAELECKEHVCIQEEMKALEVVQQGKNLQS